MRIEDVRTAIAGIEEAEGDDETQHANQDVLYVAVLKAIANGECDEPAALAREALRVNDMDFSRWYS